MQVLILKQSEESSEKSVWDDTEEIIKRGMVWGGRREESSGWVTCVYPWWIHVDIWQNQYNIIPVVDSF